MRLVFDIKSYLPCRAKINLEDTLQLQQFLPDWIWKGVAQRLKQIYDSWIPNFNIKSQWPHLQGGIRN